MRPRWGRGLGGGLVWPMALPQRGCIAEPGVAPAHPRNRHAPSPCEPCRAPDTRKSLRVALTTRAPLTHNRILELESFQTAPPPTEQAPLPGTRPGRLKAEATDV